MRKKQIQLKEMELHVLSNMDKDNAKQLNAMLDTYRKMLFPGAETDDDRDSELEKAKAALAREANKVLLVKKLKPGEQLPGKSDPRFSALGARHAADLEREKMKQRRMLRNRKRK